MKLPYKTLSLQVLEHVKGNVTWAAQLPDAAAAKKLLSVNEQSVAVTYYTPG